MADDYDVVVVGSGASAMTAALAAASQGASVVVLEKGARYGGSSALSGGQMWIPNNRFEREAGIADSKELARNYLGRVGGGRADPKSVRSFVQHGPGALDFLLRETPLKPELRSDEPDYHPEWEGSSKGGRTLDPGLFDGSILGVEYRRLLHNPQYHLPHGIHVTSREFEALMRGQAVREIERRQPHILTLGEALVGALRSGLLRRKVPVLLSHRAITLTRDGTRVVGVVALSGGRQRVFRARKGVVLAAGGFEGNESMKKRYLSARSENSAGSPSNTGDGIKMGVAVGAATSLMDEAWWFTLILKPGEKRGWLATSERTLPGSILVNRKGLRFTNEAMNYLDVARAMLSLDPVRYETPNMPAYLIFDSSYAAKYPIAGMAPSESSPDWVARSRTLGELAEKLGIDSTGLEGSVRRFNDGARKGLDPDFGRGSSFYDRHWGDPKAENPTLGPVDAPPFYGVGMLAGDIGTKGGLTTDGKARVLGADGRAIPGLFSAGNNSASVMGAGYAGSGATLGPCITFGYLAGISISAS